nr:metallophosphoesterase [Deltaproteobacteria bacterium]
MFLQIRKFLTYIAIFTVFWSSCKPTTNDSKKQKQPNNFPNTGNKKKLLPPDCPRIIAIGDLHGDLDVARQTLQLAGAINKSGKWIGKKLIVVQTGDILDKGDQEKKIINLFARLKKEAARKGGAVYT